MKTKSLLVITLLAFTTIFIGCKKYEEGPKFITFRSVKSRLTNGEWKLDKLTVSGIDSTSDYKLLGFSYNFTKVSSTATSSSSLYDYTQTYTYGGVLNTASGYVYFSNHGDDIQMELSSYYTGYNTYVPPIFGGDDGSSNSNGYYSSSTGSAPIWTIKKLTNKEFWMETTLSGRKYVMQLVKG